MCFRKNSVCIWCTRCRQQSEIIHFFMRHPVHCLEYTRHPATGKRLRRACEPSHSTPLWCLPSTSARSRVAVASHKWTSCSCVPSATCPTTSVHDCWAEDGRIPVPPPPPPAQLNVPPFPRPKCSHSQAVGQTTQKKTTLTHRFIYYVYYINNVKIIVTLSQKNAAGALYKTLCQNLQLTLCNK